VIAAQLNEHFSLSLNEVMRRKNKPPIFILPGSLTSSNVIEILIAEVSAKA